MDTETCFKFLVTHFPKRNSLGIKRDKGENFLVTCKGGVERGKDGCVPRREGAAARVGVKCCRSLLV